MPCTSLPVLGVVADFNGDGLPDMIFAYQQANYQQGVAVTNRLVLSVLINDSPGSGLLVPGVSSATYTFPVGYDSLVTAFGTNLAAATASAGPGPLPTDLGGIKLHLRGSDGVEKMASLLYVSSTQINYVIPDGIVWPLAAVSIEHEGMPFVEEAVAMPVGPSAPGLFTLNAAGLAAATAVRVASDGTQTGVPVVSCTASGCAAVPIDVTSGTVYLSLYGTGFSVNWDGSALSPTNNYVGGCVVNELFVPTTYSGPQGQFPGLDQINLQLPASFAGSGDSVVDCGFRIIETNDALHIKVRIRIQ